MPTPYAIADLARLTGISVRTIRYYLAQGLLPASGETGPGAHYGEGHLDRLRLTKRLQEQHLPLAEIRRRLSELTDAQVAGLLAAPAVGEHEAAQTSALEYVRNLLGQGTAGATGESGPTGGTGVASAGHAGGARPPHPSVPPPASLPGARESMPIAAYLSHAPRHALPGDDPSTTQDAAASLARAAFLAPATAVESATEATPGEPARTRGLMARVAMPRMRDAPAMPPEERSQWERLSLGPNVEIHIRRPLSRIEQRRVERLITIARQVLKEETP
jgi:DNA-binding transcriptional MerR regulator